MFHSSQSSMKLLKKQLSNQNSHYEIYRYLLQKEAIPNWHLSLSAKINWRALVSPWRTHCMYCTMSKSISQAEGTSNSKNQAHILWVTFIEGINSQFAKTILNFVATFWKYSQYNSYIYSWCACTYVTVRLPLRAEPWYPISHIQIHIYDNYVLFPILVV